MSSNSNTVYFLASAFPNGFSFEKQSVHTGYSNVEIKKTLYNEVFDKKYDCSSGIYKVKGNDLYYINGGTFKPSRSSSPINYLVKINVTFPNTNYYCSLNNYGYSSVMYKFSSDKSFTYIDFNNTDPSDKLNILYNSINNVYQNYIEQYDYNEDYVMETIAAIRYENTTKRYLGVLNSDEINIIQNRNNWLTSLMNGKYLGFLDRTLQDRISIAYYNKSDSYVYGSSLESCDNSKCDLTSISYVPTIKLKDGVYVSGGSGTKLDPYILRMK